jgi:hypothetical protein
VTSVASVGRFFYVSKILNRRAGVEVAEVKSRKPPTLYASQFPETGV